MVRITSGEFRGRSIGTPPGERTRPTQARLRQALLNSLQASITGARVLDLFSGSGALGFEALSRGASEVVFVESARPAIQFIHRNARTLGVEERVRIIPESVDQAWRAIQATGPFDIVLADPPYEGGWEVRLLNEAPWGGLLREGGHFCLEWGALKSRVETLPDRTPFLVKIREKNYGDSVLTTFVADGRQRVADPSAAPSSEGAGNEGAGNKK